MGEAKSRRNRLAALQAVQPFCIYCGGSTHGDTIDHMPPIAVFDLRRRPKGLEFLACAACNGGGKGAEQIIGYLSRVYPDAMAPHGQLEVRKILQAIKNNHPRLLEEMLPSAEQDRRFRQYSHRVPGAGGALNVGGPLVW
jgi:hypothetical protein